MNDAPWSLHHQFSGTLCRNGEIPPLVIFPLVWVMWQARALYGKDPTLYYQSPTWQPYWCFLGWHFHTRFPWIGRKQQLFCISQQLLWNHPAISSTECEQELGGQGQPGRLTPQASMWWRCRDWLLFSGGDNGLAGTLLPPKCSKPQRCTHLSTASLFGQIE